MNAALEHPGLGTLGKLPREIRDMIYTFLAVDIQNASRMTEDKSDVVRASRLLPILKSRVEKSTSKQLYVEFVETIARISTIKDDLDSPREKSFEELLQYLESYLGPDLVVGSLRLGFRSYHLCDGNHHQYISNHGRHYRYGLDVNRDMFEEALKRLYSCHVQHNLPAHKILLDCNVQLWLSRVGLDLPHGSYDLYTPVNFALSMADPEASAQSFMGAMILAKEMLKENLSDLRATGRIMEVFTDQRGEFQVFDRFCRSMIDWAFDYWNTKDDEVRNEERLKLQESFSAQEDENAADTHQDRPTSPSSSLNHATSHGESSLASNSALDLGKN